MEINGLNEITDDEIVFASFGDQELRGPTAINGRWFFDLSYTDKAMLARAPVVSPRTELGSLPRPLIPISPWLARALGLPDINVALDS